MENFDFIFDDDDWDDEEWDDEEEFFDFEQIIDDAQEQQIQNLYYALMSQPVKQLRAIAKRRSWPVKGTRKDDLVEQIAEQMLMAVQQPDFLKALTAEEHELVAILNTLFNLNNTLYFGQIQHIWRDALDRKKSVHPILSGLESYGLIYECKEHGADIHYHPYLTMPVELLPVYPVFPSRKLGKSNRKSLPTPPNILQQFEQFMATLAAGHSAQFTPKEGKIEPEGHELYFVGNWPYLSREVDKLPKFSPYFFMGGKNSYLTVPLRKQILDPVKNKALINITGDKFKADWFVSLAMQLQILILEDEDREGQDVVQFNPEPWSMVLSMDSQERLQFLFQAWRNSVLDLHEIRKLLTQKSKIDVIRRPNPDIPYQAFLFDNMLTRQTLVRILQGLAEDDQLSNEWHSFEQLAEDFYIHLPDFCHSLTSVLDWGFKEGRKTLDVGKRKDWFKTYGRMLQFMFSGPLYWLNVVELQKKINGIHAFRLTTTGKALLSPKFDLDHIDETTSPGEVIWLDGRTAKVAPGYEVTAFLGLITHLATAVPNKPFTYALAPEQIEHAFIAGESPDTLNRLFLESGWRLPEEGYSYIEELYGRFGKTHIYENLTLIEFNDDHALRELQAAGILKDALIYEFSPRLIAVDPDMVANIIKQLEKRNYTPRTMQGQK